MKPCEAVVLAGGPVDLKVSPKPLGKGLVTVGGVPMAQRAVQALAASPAVARVIVVSPVALDWPSVDTVVPSGERLMQSFSRGLGETRDMEHPALVVCGDLPFLTGEAITDFVERCGRRPEADIWYGYLRRETSERVFPGVRHTWAKLADGTYCGTGMMMLRPRVVAPLEEFMASLTRSRKNLVKLAACLGFGTVFAYLTGRLTVPMAEAAGARLFGGIPVAGVESAFAETAFNVDDDGDLEYAVRRVMRDA